MKNIKMKKMSRKARAKFIAQTVGSDVTWYNKKTMSRKAQDRIAAQSACSDGTSSTQVWLKDVDKISSLLDEVCGPDFHEAGLDTEHDITNPDEWTRELDSGNYNPICSRMISALVGQFLTVTAPAPKRTKKRPAPNRDIDSRKKRLRTFCALTSVCVSEDLHDDQISRELCSAFLTSLPSLEDTEEALLTLRAFDLTMITGQPSFEYADAGPALQQIVTDADNVAVKAAAMASFGLFCFIIKIDGNDSGEVVEFLMSVLRTHGSSIGETDDAVIAATLAALSLVLSDITDLAEYSASTAELVVEFTGSLNANVATEAISCLALLYQKSYRPRTADDPWSRANRDFDSGEASGAAVYDSISDLPTLVRAYYAFHRKSDIVAALENLSRQMDCQMSKEDYCLVHDLAIDALNTLDNPLREIRSRSDAELRGKSRNAVTKSSTFVATSRDEEEGFWIKTWTQLCRYRLLLVVLKTAGFIEHWNYNELVQAALLDDIAADATESGDAADAGYKRNAQWPDNRPTGFNKLARSLWELGEDAWVG